MELYFGKPDDGKTILLSEEESHHLTKVRRGNFGEIFLITDGEGTIYHAQLESFEGRRCRLIILRSERQMRNECALHLVVAPTKNIDRMEWLVEKATEIGTSHFSFVQCRHSERKEIRSDRLEKIILSAVKQSARAYLPKVHGMITLPEYLNKIDSRTQRFICTLDAETHLFDAMEPRMDTVLLIGPEGDFHRDEVALALTHGFRKVSLGLQRLRTETAALFACATFNLRNK